MAYSKPVNIFDERDTTVKLKSRQEENSLFLKKPEESDFGKRLREVFSGADNGTIAEKLEVGASSVTAYMNGTSYPKIPTLIELSAKLKFSLHWLLTGEGEGPTEQYAFLTEVEREAVENLARIEKKEFEDILQELVSFAFARRAAELLSAYERLDTKDRRVLLAIYPLLLGEESQADVKAPPLANDRR